MCYHGRQTKTIDEVTEELRKTFPDVRVENPQDWFMGDANGFAYPNIPIVFDGSGLIKTDFTWGLLPAGRKEDFRKSTLNARLETIETKPSFQNYVDNRCVILMDGYYDWHWDTPDGKKKTKHIVHSCESETFGLAGIYSTWKDATGRQWNTYAIVTTAPNPAMKYVHNRKADIEDERMPVMLRSGDEKAWLDVANPIQDFAYPNYQPNLITFTV
jgi:putative SOS response-associated peptidase YedK